MIRINATAARRLRDLLGGNPSSLIPCLRLAPASEGQRGLLLEGIPEEEELIEFDGLALLVLDRAVLPFLEGAALEGPHASEARHLKRIK
ncbi:MAG: hypothetical protein Q8P59_00415 [Dehalococcoidia bacterium]|nr:hypothetical protein [Dehalococcoidia bacterium]